MLVDAKCLDSLELIQPPSSKNIQLFRWDRGSLPPIRRLVLDGVRWVLTDDTYHQVWDFSRLEELVIKNLTITDLVGFIRSVQPEAVSQLRSLRIVLNKSRLGRWGLTDGLTHYLANWIRQAPLLEALEIPCCVEEFPVPLLLQCRHLRTLKLRDFSDFGTRGFPIGLQPFEPFAHDPSLVSEDFNLPQSYFDLSSQYPAISVKDLERLKKACPLVEELDLGFRNKGEDVC
jgi:hypothetical protein